MTTAVPRGANSDPRSWCNKPFLQGASGLCITVSTLSTKHSYQQSTWAKLLLCLLEAALTTWKSYAETSHCLSEEEEEKGAESDSTFKLHNNYDR